MDTDRLIHLLSDPRAYPQPCAGVEVRQTHISAVFLAGDHAYKIKKPLDLGFLDFTTLERRLHFCREEVRLNRRLAPDVYLDVVPVVRAGAGLQVGGAGEALEWAVRMRRLPDAATLASRLAAGTVPEGFWERLACRLAAFHASAAAGPEVAAFGRWEVVAGNARENFSQTRARVGRGVAPEVYRRVRALTEAALAELRPLVEARAAAGVPRDTHGDLHLDHVYLFPERTPPGDLVVVDCIEFNRRFRYADPLADLAFLTMDLAYADRRDLAERLTQAYVGASGDRGGTPLLPFYKAYRAVVRAKVEGFEAAEPEVGGEARCRAERAASAHWLLALGELEPPLRRPGLVLVAGLPGTGKSTLVQGLVASAGFASVSSDATRKDLAGLPPDRPQAPVAFGTGLYDANWDERTYRECLGRAEQVVRGGGRVVVDASFRSERRRREFLAAARAWGVRSALLHCQAAPEAVRARLRGRRAGPSDADWEVYQRVAQAWEGFGAETRGKVHLVSAGGTREAALAEARVALRVAGLA